MATRTTFSILTKPAGFFSYGGHEASDDEIEMKAEIGEPYSDEEFSHNKFSEDFGGMPLFMDIQAPTDMTFTHLGATVDPSLMGHEFDNIFYEHQFEGGKDRGKDNDDLFKQIVMSNSSNDVDEDDTDLM